MRPPDDRPVLVALAGPNGAGKTTFYHAHLSAAGLRFINADHLARELDLDAAQATAAADALRFRLLAASESFILETVFSDPVRDKMRFLKDAVASGYTVILCFIGVSGPAVSEERVAMRVSQGGHDVPRGKIRARFPRTMANLKAAIRELPQVWVFDHSELATPFRKVAVFENGRPVFLRRPAPSWLQPLIRGLQ